MKKLTPVFFHTTTQFICLKHEQQHINIVLFYLSKGLFIHIVCSSTPITFMCEVNKLQLVSQKRYF